MAPKAHCKRCLIPPTESVPFSLLVPIDAEACAEVYVGPGIYSLSIEADDLLIVRDN